MLYFQKFHIYLISDSQNIFHSLYMAMCQFGDVEKALFSRYDFNKSSVLFNRLHRTVVGGTFVQMACNRLNPLLRRDRKSTRLNSSHVAISYAVFCLKKKKRP